MCKWEEIGISKEMFEACERLAQEGVVSKQIDKCCVEKADISELKCDKVSTGDVDSFVTIVGDNNGYSISEVNKDSINLKINNLKNEKSDMLELGCNNKIISGNIDTTSVSIDGIPLEDFICCKNEKSVYQEVMEYVTSNLSDELWKMLEETEDEEGLCLECLVQHFLEKAYSEGYKEATKYMTDRISDIKEEFLIDVAEAGYED
ncbi:hypothetical protein QTH25_13000 [Clostridium perfringens]|uniref:hypothetical protein n=1 Tax=Clostridium perfringens TaxID=1502 RepID=UPI00338D7DD9|nr:hypothetical protein [Clostridium perfringens]